MAAVERLASTDPLDTTQWLVLRGTLGEADLIPLLEGTGDAMSGDVTLDLFNLERLTPGGCWTIRNLADDLWSHGRLLSVVFRVEGDVADALRSTGTIHHPGTVFLGTPGD